MTDYPSPVNETVSWIAGGTAGTVFYLITVIAFTPHGKNIDLLALAPLNLMAAGSGFLVVLLIAALVRRGYANLDDATVVPTNIDLD